MKERAKAEARAIFGPKFEELRERVEKIGWRLTIGEEKACVKESSYRYDKEYSFTIEGFEEFYSRFVEAENRVAEWEARRENNARIHKVLDEIGFPSNLFDLFDNSEELDEVIRKDAKIIMSARDIEKDEMDMHELCACGIDRRCNAIYRVLDRAGGENIKINIYGQSGSRRLASYLAGER